MSITHSKSDIFQPVGASTPNGSRPTDTLEASKDLQDKKESKNAKYAKSGKELTSSEPPQAARELFKKLQEYGDSSELHDLAEDLFNLVVEKYAYVKKGDAKLDDLMLFLLDKTDNYPGSQFMDFCIRWYILVESLNPKILTERPGKSEAAREIARWIVEMWPRLAFENFSSEKRIQNQNQNEKGEGGVNDSPSFYKVDCRHKIVRSCTPFHLAAASGNYKILEIMLNKAKAVYVHPPASEPSASAPAPASARESKPRDTLLELVCSEDPETGENAFTLAFRASRDPLATLQVLLRVTKAKTPLDDGPFSQAIERGYDLVVEEYLKTELQLGTTEFGKYMAAAFQYLGVEKKHKDRGMRTPTVYRARIVDSLIRRATTTDKFTEKVAEDIIEKNLVEVWDARCSNVPDENIQARLLHMAVLYQRHEFVERFVKDYAWSLIREEKVPNNSDEKYPLWYNNHKYDKKVGFSALEHLSDADEISERAKIRKTIVTKMIHDLDMDVLTDILHQSDGTY